MDWRIAAGMVSGGITGFAIGHTLTRASVHDPGSMRWLVEGTALIVLATGLCGLIMALVEHRGGTRPRGRSR